MAWADRKTYQGKAVNAGTLAIINAANQLLRSSYFGGEKSNLTLTQGGYNRGGVSASAGTHDGGGAIDITAHNWKNREKVFRLLGVAMWDRPTLPGVWSHHIHGIVCGDGTASAGAKRQVTSYYKRRNGLANNGADKGYKMLVFPLFVDPAKSVGKPGVRYLKQDFTSREQPTTKAKSRGLIKKNSKFTVVAVVNVSGDYWAINVDGKFVPTAALTTKKPEEKPVVKTEPFNAVWRVTVNGKWGYDAPGGNKKYERAAGYKLTTTERATVNGVQWYVTKYGTWYDAQHLVVWIDQPAPEPTPEPEPEQPKKVGIRAVCWNVYGSNHGDADGGDKAWSVRGPKLAASLKAMDADIYLLMEINRQVMIDTISSALGSDFIHVPSPRGHNDVWYRKSILSSTRPPVEYPLSDYQHRAALVMHFAVKGMPDLAFVHTHLPSANTAEREKAAKQLVKLLGDVEDSIILTGDFNNTSEYSGGPRSQFMAAWYKDIRKQVNVTNKEYSQHTTPQAGKPFVPVKGTEWLSDVWSNPKVISFSSGILDLTAGISDHQAIIFTLGEKDSPIVPEPQPFAESKKYKVNANPFLWGLDNPGSGNERKIQRPNGSTFTSQARISLSNNEDWVQGTDGFWSHAGYLKEVTETTLDINIGTINVIRWRLGTKNVRGVGSFKKGLDYSKRLPGFAKMQKQMDASVIGTVESGQYADANELSKAFGKTWKNVLHGDNAGDLTQAIHWDSSKRKLVSSGKYTTYGSHHNWATWVILEDIESHVLFMVVCYHAEYRTRGTKSATVYDKDRERQTNVLASKAQDVAKAQAKLLGVKHIPIVYVGDFNQDKDAFYDGPGKAMAAAGNVDTETIALSKTGPSNTFPNIDGLKSSPRRFDRIFVKRGTPVTWMRTVFGPPNTDHNGVSISVILSND